MPNIITTTEVQKSIGSISGSITEQSYIVTNRGKGKIVMLPYFEGCDDTVADYLEDFAMARNVTVLKQRYKNQLNLVGVINFETLAQF